MYVKTGADWTLPPFCPMTFPPAGGILEHKGGFLMREFFHNMKLSFLLAAVLYIILGLILLIWPGVSATVFCYAFGSILLIYGVVTIVSFFLRDSRHHVISSISSVNFSSCGKSIT